MGQGPEQDGTTDSTNDPNKTGENPAGPGGGGGEGEKATDDQGSKIAKLTQEATERRLANKDLQGQLDKALADLKAFTDRDKTEIEKATGAVQDLTDQNAKLADKVNKLALENAFLSDNTFKWRNPRAALKLADLSKVKIDDDGTVTGLGEALKELAKSDPYLLAEEAGDDDQSGKSPTGQPPKNKTPRGTPEREKLLAKYPALRR